MPRGRSLIDDSLDMTTSSYQNFSNENAGRYGVGNESFVNDDPAEEVDHVEQDDAASSGSDTEVSRCSRCCTQEYITVTILVCINLLNYMDRFTPPGVESGIEEYYNIDNAKFGLIQTCFIASYMVFSPLFGYLGDRFNRKVLMSVGIGLWTLTTAASSFVPAEYFWLFLVARGLIGIGEASYSTVAPTIFADLFERDTRSKVLAVFYFAIPVGSGLGYIVGSGAASLMGSWQWALRVTPILGVILFFLIIFLVKDPPRGRSEGGGQLHTTSYCADIRYLFLNKSYVFVALAFTCVSYVTGALAWWAPSFFNDAANYYVKPGEEPVISKTTIPFVFGGITMVAGIIGVVTGSETARRWRSRIPYMDALVCGIGLLASTPFIYFALITSQFNLYAAFALTLFGEIFICLNWSLVVDIMLAVVIPTRQATASGLQNLLAHALGDAGSPYIIGQISEVIGRRFVDPNSHRAKFISMQYALYTTAFIAAIGGGFFLLVALFYVRDRAACRRIIDESQRPPIEVVQDQTDVVNSSQRNIDYNEASLVAAVDLPETPDYRNHIT